MKVTIERRAEDAAQGISLVDLTEGDYAEIIHCPSSPDDVGVWVRAGFDGIVTALGIDAGFVSAETRVRKLAIGEACVITRTE